MYADFLVLSLLFCIPGTLVYALRRDLRRVIHTIGIVSIPFALTERYFYPSYWEPQFLWDLADKIGFGIEDIIFVVGLGALTSTVYAFCFRKKYSENVLSNRRSILLYSVGALCSTALLIALAIMAAVPMIYASVVIMLLMSGGIIAVRKDLLIPSLAGGAITCAIYTLLCILFSLLFKNIFHVVWHGDKFSNIFFAGILLEEYMYGFAAGVAGTMFYPFVSGRRFVSCV
jgi:hypothetical protein